MVRANNKIVATALSLMAVLSIASLVGCGKGDSENKGPYASEVESKQIEIHPLDAPEIAPQGLYAGEYLRLADYYIQNWNYKQAAFCLAKVKQLAPGTSLEHKALQTEKYRLFNAAQYEKWKKVEALREDEDQYKLALEKFVDEYPFCQFALNELLENSYSDGETFLDLKKRLRLADPENESYFEDQMPAHEFHTGITGLNALVRVLLTCHVDDHEARTQKYSGFIDKSGQIVFNVDNPEENSEDFHEQIVLANAEYLDPTGKIIKTPEFDAGYYFSEGFAPIRTMQGWGFINAKGVFVSKKSYNSLLWFSEGLAPVKIADNWGYIDKSEKLVIKPQYEQALCFREGLAAVLVGKKVGFIDKTGKFVIPAKYDVAESFNEGLARVTILETSIFRRHDYFIDTKGKIVFDLKAEKVKYDPFGSSLQFGNIEYDVDRIIARDVPPNPIEHWPSTGARESINFFHDDRLLVQLGSTMGYLDKKGNVAIAPNFYKALDFSDGLALVSLDPPNKSGIVRNKNQRLGYINTSGKMVIPAKYSEARSFSEGLAFVREPNGAAGFIDKSGKMVISVVGDARDFHEGLAPVTYKDGTFDWF